MLLSVKILILGEICSSVEQCHSENTVVLHYLGSVNSGIQGWEAGNNPV